MKQPDYNQWFGHRVKEILAEKNITVNSLSTQTGFSRPTITRVLNGHYAAPDFVNKVAELLHITTDRFKQADVEYTPAKWSRTREILDSDVTSEIHAAKSHFEKALGETEKGIALQVLGSVYFCRNEYRNAVETYRQSHSFLSKSWDVDWVLRSYESLLHGDLACHDFDSFDQTFAEAVKRFEHDPERYMRLLEVKVAFWEKQKNVTEAKRYYELIIDTYKAHQVSEDEPTLMLLSRCYLKVQDYKNAFSSLDLWYKRYFQQASPHTPLEQFRALLEYCKTAYAIGHEQLALDTLETNLAGVLEQNDFPLCNEYLVFLHLMKKCKRFDTRFLTDHADDDTRLIASVVNYLCSSDENSAMMLFNELSKQMILEYI